MTGPGQLAELRQGHLYQHGDMRVIAMESGPVASVREIDQATGWLNASYTARAEWLAPLPMKYFGGAVPA